MSHTQRAGSVAVVSLLVLFGATGAATAQDVEPGSTQGAAPRQTGWWWRVNDKPDTGSVDPVRPSSPNVPEGAVPVSAVAGEPEKISAIEFALEAEPGARVTSFLLALREGDHPGANVGEQAPTTRVAACQITEFFWASEEAAAWETRPDYDEGSCVPGLRAEDGIWTFDLSALAGRWLAEDSELSASVMLVPEQGEESAAPPSFQITYDGVTEDGIGVHATVKGGTPPPDDDPATEADESTTADVDAQANAGAFGGGAPDAAAEGQFDAGTPDTSSGGVAMNGEVPEAADGPSAPAGGKPAVPDPALAAGPAAAPPGLSDGIPLGAWFLIPVVLGLAYLMTLGLGSRGEPTAGASGRGVARALERRHAGSNPEGAL